MLMLLDKDIEIIAVIFMLFDTDINIDLPFWKNVALAIIIASLVFTSMHAWCMILFTNVLIFISIALLIY